VDGIGEHVELDQVTAHVDDEWLGMATKGVAGGSKDEVSKLVVVMLHTLAEGTTYFTLLVGEDSFNTGVVLQAEV
jgi:hypothetical protein